MGPPLLLLFSTSSRQIACFPSPHIPPFLFFLRPLVPAVLLLFSFFFFSNPSSPFLSGYLNGTCILTVQAAKALALVQQDLTSQGYSLKVYDCYRPQVLDLPPPPSTFCGYSSSSHRSLSLPQISFLLLASFLFLFLYPVLPIPPFQFLLLLLFFLAVPSL